MARIDRVAVSFFDVSLDEPHGDGTLAWDSTGVVVVETSAGGEHGLGFTYGPRACVSVVGDTRADAERYLVSSEVCASCACGKQP